MFTAKSGWTVSALVGTAVIGTVAFMPMSHPARGGAPVLASAGAAVSDDVNIVPKRGPIPGARARVVQVSMLCPYFTEEGDLAGCVLHEPTLRHAPPASVPRSVHIAERCGQTMDPRACDPARIGAAIRDAEKRGE